MVCSGRLDDGVEEELMLTASETRNDMVKASCRVTGPTLTIFRHSVRTEDIVSCRYNMYDNSWCDKKIAQYQHKLVIIRPSKDARAESLLYCLRGLGNENTSIAHIPSALRRVDSSAGGKQNNTNYEQRNTALMRHSCVSARGG